MIEFIQALAHDTGQILLKAYQKQSAGNLALRQSPKQLKLAEDKTIDQYIIQRIQQQFPSHGILTEESGLVHSSDSKYLWIVDPIDGSVNFSTHNPFFAISIALLIDGQLELGVVEAPLLGEQFVAQRGCGATVNGQPIHVSTTATLADTYLVTCDGGMTDRTQVFSTLIRNYYDQVKDIRKLGSAALECAWVAAGRADAYITMAIDPWDVAAGVLLVQEAGGTVTTFTGAAWTPVQSDLICSNGLLQSALSARLW
ncbi:MAG: inositol monophosphatase [Candidatus Kerfeldbacteria bacterium]|nr:inositol monophosphatase [Candidatus Kerfeldbacteria bacterium]